MKGDTWMADIIEAVYEGGVLKLVQPLGIREHTRVRITIEPEDENSKNAEYILALARQSCEGLSKEELAIIESAKLRSERFFH
jgi:predicted DNA-binding antitoxin AbrB/MazE fold protein